MSLLLAFGIGFSNSSFVMADNIKVIKVIGNHVNIRTEPTTSNKNNIIGRVNKGDTFTLLKHIDDWYLIDYYGEFAYISDTYGLEINEDIETMDNDTNEDVLIGKVVGNNINIRNTPNISNDNIIGFADITDSFKILEKENEWYKIDYHGYISYIKSDFIEERIVNERDLKIKKIVYLNCDSPLYSDCYGTYLTRLPKYQNVNVLKEEKGYYKVMVDGVIGYIDPIDTSKLTNTFVLVDLGRQIVKIFKNNKEVYRAHMISGRKKMQTDIGIYKIGHRLTNYQLTKNNKVSVWIQYNGNEGLHDAGWQKPEYFTEVANDAYERFENGEARTYPFNHGSHGCDNLQLVDALNIYELVEVGDNVLVIGPNNLVKDNLISSNIECKELQKVLKYI